MNLSVLDLYKDHLGKRYESFLYVFNKLSKKKNNIIVEFGTSRSFVTNGIPGCMSDDSIYWDEKKIDSWDWGAGIFTRVCAEIIHKSKNFFYTIDPSERAMNISKTMTSDYKDNIEYLHTTSTNFIMSIQGKIDLIYMDHHETCEEGAQLHLQDIRILVENDLLSDKALILIDDVHLEPSTVRAGLSHKLLNSKERTFENYGKGKYSIPYLLTQGYEITFEGYQVIMEKGK